MVLLFSVMRWKQVTGLRLLNCTILPSIQGAQYQLPLDYRTPCRLKSFCIKDIPSSK